MIKSERMRFGLAACVIALLAAVIPDSAQAQERAGVTPIEIMEPELIYGQYCAACHGSTGKGSIIGPSLVSMQAKAMSDADLHNAIADGSQEAGMPMFGRGLTRGELTRLVEFVRSLQSKARVRNPRTEAKAPIAADGNVIAGELLFFSKGRCSQCHTVFDSGGIAGPDLSHIGSRYGPGQIYEAITRPDKKVDRDFRSMNLTTADGTQIFARFRNDNKSTVQLLDESGKLWTTYFKAEVQSADRTRDSLMPGDLLEALTDDERKDLLTFLTGLK